MQVKMFELRDRGTFIPIMCVRLECSSEEERYLLARGGWGRTNDDFREHIVFIPMSGDVRSAWSDPYDHSDVVRTYREAHFYVIKNWDKLKSGDVICVEFILGERSKPKTSEREFDPL